MLAAGSHKHESEISSCRLRCDTDCESNPATFLNKPTKKSSADFSWLPLMLNAAVGAVYLAIFIPLNNDGYKFMTFPGFFCKDPTLSYKYKGDTIHLKHVFMGSIFLPLGWLLLLELSRSIIFSKLRIKNLLNLYWDYLVGGCIGWGISTIAKILIQSPRPDFFDYCNPDTGVNCTAGTHVESFNKCLNINHMYNEFRTWMSVSSFPSGHSMVLAYSTLFCSYLIETRFLTSLYSMALKALLHILSLTWITAGLLSRFTDRRHHWWDILAGSTIGVINALYIIYIVNKKYNLSCAEITLKDSEHRNSCVYCTS